MKDMKNIRVGFLHHGNDEEVWGSVITTYYLEKAFQRLGCKTWRISVTMHQDYPKLLKENTDLIICEGVPEWQIPKGVWDTTDVKIFWWMSDLFYDLNTVSKSSFDAVATNSTLWETLREKGKISRRIDLAVDKDFAKNITKKREYECDFVYIGNYPHKSKEQMELLFKGAAKNGTLAIWGTGWDESPYSEFYKGVLPLDDIPAVYNSSRFALMLTEERQKSRGMINNRVYEVLGSGCCPICEEYPSLMTSDMGRFIHFVKTEEDIANLTKLDGNSEFKQLKAEAQKYVTENHNYDIRANFFIELYKEVIEKRQAH